jgi:DUF1365 family protein
MIWDCFVIHSRKSPKVYRFGFNFFWCQVDLDQLEQYQKLPVFSYNRFNMFSFYDKDHRYQKDLSCKESTLRYLEQNGIARRRVKKIELLTNLRMLGYVFNPVSYYFIELDEGEHCCLIEICNTFKEIKPYLVPPQPKEQSLFTIKTIKNFYISPFTELDNTMEFKIERTDSKLQIHIFDYEKDQLILSTHLKGSPVQLTSANLIKRFIRFPLLTIRITWSIHWHALKLYLKKIPFKRKDDDKHLQKGALPWRL